MSKKLDLLMREYIQPYKLYGDEDPVREENIVLRNKLKFVQFMLKDLPTLIWSLDAKDLKKVHEILHKLEFTSLAIKDKE